MSRVSAVCRTCLGIISDGKVGYNIDVENGVIKNVRNIREMLTFCFPEMDTYISVSPSVCNTCLNILVNMYNFKIRCLRVENAIRQYIQTNNLMEGSSVDLSNVVRLQIKDALKQKKWNAAMINEYISKVDSCLQKSRKNIVGLPVTTLMPNPFSRPQIRPSIPVNCDIPDVVFIQEQHPPNMPNSRYLTPNTLVASNALHSTFPFNTVSVASTTSQTWQTVCNTRTEPSGSQYLRVSDDLMPTVRGNNRPTVGGNNMPNNPPGAVSNQIANSFHQPSSTSVHQPTSTRVQFPNRHHTKTNYMNTLNLVSKSGMGVQESVLIRSRLEQPPMVNTRQVLCPVTGQFFQQSLEKGIKRVYGPKQQKQTSQTNNSLGEVLVMNFDEGEFSGQELDTNGSLTVQQNAVPKVIIKLPQLNKETVKRKLSPHHVIEEIVSKRRKLIVRVNSNLPYLHKNKKLVVRLSQDRFHKCTFCKSFAALTMEGLQKHHESRHKTCRLCSFKCGTSLVLDKHINSEHAEALKNVLKALEEANEQYPCMICNFNGLSLFDLRDHRLRVHLKCDTAGTYKCPFESCDMESALSYNVARHIEFRHDQERKKACPLCCHVASRSGPSRIKQHIFSHVLNRLGCSFCSFTCKTSFLLNRHMDKMHKGIVQPSGVVFEVEDSDSELTTDQDGRITLNREATKANENLPSSSGEFDWNQPSLFEMLCAQSFEVLPEQANDCEIVDPEPGQENMDDCVVIEDTVGNPEKNPIGTEIIEVEDEHLEDNRNEEDIQTIDLTNKQGSANTTEPTSSESQNKGSKELSVVGDKKCDDKATKGLEIEALNDSSDNSHGPKVNATCMTKEDSVIEEVSEGSGKGDKLGTKENETAETVDSSNIAVLNDAPEVSTKEDDVADIVSSTVSDQEGKEDSTEGVNGDKSIEGSTQADTAAMEREDVSTSVADEPLTGALTPIKEKDSIEEVGSTSADIDPTSSDLPTTVLAPNASEIEMVSQDDAGKSLTDSNNQLPCAEQDADINKLATAADEAIDGILQSVSIENRPQL